MAKILGLPPEEMTDDMLAGGNITINPQPVASKSNLGPWLFASVLLILAGLAGVGLLYGAWPIRTPVSPIKPVPAAGSNEYLGIEVIPR